MRAQSLYTASIACSAVAALGCSSKATPSAGSGPLIVYSAGSLARPLKAALDSFARVEGTTYQMESSGSLEAARKVTELGKIPDVLALADVEVFPLLLVPKHAAWYATFATNRMVLAKSPHAKYGTAINANNWSEILQRDGVETGRADPSVDPAGYRTLLVFQLAEHLLRKPGLAAALERASPRKNIRPKSAELTALTQAGELDYAWEYESVARAAGLDFVSLNESMGLGSLADSLKYKLATVRVPGSSPKDSITIVGTPIRYALSIPIGATHAALAERFVRFLGSPAGRDVLRKEFLPVLDAWEWIGPGIPPSLGLKTLRAIP
jgi:molybdate/tungstate transport system substrate-binding protein